MGIHLVIKEGRAFPPFLPWEPQGRSRQGGEGEGKECLETTGPWLHRAGATGRGVLGSPRGQAFPLQTSLPGPTQIYLGFPQRGAQHKWQWRAGQVAAAHSRAWEAEPRALGALAVFERGLDAPAVGVRQMDPPGGEAVLGRRPQTLERNCGPGEEVG